MSTPSNPQLFPWMKDGDTPVTLRDLFAAFALAGLYASEAVEGGPDYSWESVAKNAYGTADAMLKRREESDGE